MSINHNNRNSTGVTDENIELFDNFRGEYKGKPCLFYPAKLTYTMDKCQNKTCPSNQFKEIAADIVKNGTKSSTILLPSLANQLAVLLLKKQKYHCRNCDSYFTAETDSLGAYRGSIHEKYCQTQSCLTFNGCACIGVYEGDDPTKCPLSSRVPFGR